MEVKRAHVHGSGWVEMECDHCSTRYSCLQDQWGFSDTGWLGLAGIVPSDETMKEAAQYDLRATMKRSASRVPCPKCGKYGHAFVEAIQQRAAKLVWWLTFFGSAAAILGVFLVLWNNAPAWIFLLILAAAWVIAKVASNLAGQQVDPNRNLTANKQRALNGISKGIVRIDAGGEKSTQ
jgi:hypothetical protein